MFVEELEIFSLSIWPLNVREKFMKHFKKINANN